MGWGWAGRRVCGCAAWCSVYVHPVYTCVYRCVSSVTQSPEGSDGLVEQRGDILLLVAVRRAENHHAILTEEYTLG